MREYAVRRRAVPDESSLRGYDYADCFEAALQQPDAHSALTWARTALEGARPPVRWLIKAVHRHVLRFELGPADENHVLGWRVAEVDRDAVRLETGGPLGRAVLIARRTSPTTAIASTYLFFHRRRARVLWAVVGPLHRTLAPYLLRQAAKTLTHESEVAA
ncbi:MAG: hypothetical protein QOE05_2759 [Actinomycetota bacterium]|jgi:hypothetical protein|nr:hypothetical protein [Actinomycetota bacterium]